MPPVFFSGHWVVDFLPWLALHDRRRMVWVSLSRWYVRRVKGFFESESFNEHICARFVVGFTSSVRRVESSGDDDGLSKSYHVRVREVNREKHKRHTHDHLTMRVTKKKYLWHLWIAVAFQERRHSTEVGGYRQGGVLRMHPTIFCEIGRRGIRTTQALSVNAFFSCANSIHVNVKISLSGPPSQAAGRHLACIGPSRKL